ncbi:MAG: metallophosphoesterase family protein [Tannerella sp.]|jgi:hypothetical protein|nr:metallophosphoesterase family protein [Tannerella sp.]
MKKVSMILLLMMAAAGFAAAQPAGKPVLKFNKNGRFRIVQFTDTHLRGNCWQSDSVLILIRRVIEMERPDFVIFTGDVIQQRPEAAWHNIGDVCAKAKVPWAAVLGNHDNEYELTDAQNIQVAAGLPYSLTENGPDYLPGNGNYMLTVQASDSEKPAAAFYCLDSHRGEWNLRPDQVEWYRKQSREIADRNGGKSLPALAFFHIPIPEFELVDRKVGFFEEPLDGSPINSGMFAAMYERGDVMGIFVGHDHDNNFIGCVKNICLGFGLISGWMSYGKIGRGARVIELYEGERKFDTWIRKLYDFEQGRETWIRTGDTGRKFFVTYENQGMSYREDRLANDPKETR